MQKRRLSRDSDKKYRVCDRCDTEMDNCMVKDNIKLETDRLNSIGIQIDLENRLKKEKFQDQLDKSIAEESHIKKKLQSKIDEKNGEMRNLEELLEKKEEVYRAVCYVMQRNKDRNEDHRKQTVQLANIWTQ